MNLPTTSALTVNRLQRYPILQAFGFVFLLMASEFAFFRPYFLVNDDLFQLFILKGIGIGLSPDAHVFFSHLFFSHPLSTLYRLFPALPWYPLALLAIQYLSFSALAVALTQTTRNQILSHLFFAVFFLIFGLYNFQNINFTLTSCLAFQGGFFLLLELAENPVHPNRKTFLGLGAFCLFLSFICRPESFLISAFVALPCLLITYQRSSCRTVIRRFVLGLAVLLSFFLLVDHLYYSATPEWKKYGDTVPITRDLRDIYPLPYNQTTKPFFEEVGWSLNDLALLKSWYFWDEDIYSLENFRKLRSHFSPIKSVVEVLNSFQHFETNHTFLGLMGCFLFALPFFRRRFLKDLLINFLWCCGFLLFLALWLKLPERIYFPTLAFLVLISFRQCLQENRIPLSPADSDKRFLFLAVLLVLFIPASLYQAHRSDQYKRYWKSALKNSVASLQPKDNQLFIVWDSQYPFEYIGAFDDFSQYRNFHMLSFAGYQKAPLTKHMMSHFNLTHPLLDLVDNPSVFLICNSYSGILGLTYLREKFHVDAVALKTFESPSFTVYQLITHPTLSPIPQRNRTH